MAEEVIIEDLLREGHTLDASGFSKVLALRALLCCPDDDNPFYRHWYSFIFLTANLLGRPLYWGELTVPSPVECALSMHIALELRPLPFHDEVLGTIASSCLYHGLWCLPDILTHAQSAMMHHLKYLQIGVTSRDVKDVRGRVMRAKKQGTSISSLPDPDEEGIDDTEEIRRIQTIRVMDTFERLAELHLRGQRAKDLVFDHSDE